MLFEWVFISNCLQKSLLFKLWSNSSCLGKTVWLPNHEALPISSYLVKSPFDEVAIPFLCVSGLNSDQLSLPMIGLAGAHFCAIKCNERSVSGSFWERL